MKRFCIFIVFIFAMGITFVLPATKDLVFCAKMFRGVCEGSEVEKVKNEEQGNLNSFDNLELKASSYILIEPNSNKVLGGKEIHKHLAPASMTKVMTMLLLMENVDKGTISLSDNVRVSEYAASMEGSECYLDAGAEYCLDELLKAVAVASANDACVAIAERISGSEKVFVEEMNNRASELGMNDTHFVNSTGLDVEGHYSSAYDLCIALKALSKYEHIRELEQVWNYDMQHSKGRVTNLTNTNRLIRSFDGCYIAKTGHTDDAGYCIVACGKRQNEKYICCVMGLKDSKERFEEASKLLNFAFANYDSHKVVDCSMAVGEIKVKRGKVEKLPYFPSEDVVVVMKNDEKVEPSIQIDMTEGTLTAPISQGKKVGKLTVFVGGEKIAETSLCVNENIDENSYLDIIKNIIEA